MAWPLKHEIKRAPEPTESSYPHISTTEDMTTPTPPEPEEEKPTIPTTVFDTVVAKTTYVLSDMFVLGHPYFLTVAGKYLEGNICPDYFKDVMCSGTAILLRMGEKRESGTFLMFIPHDVGGAGKEELFRFIITITAEAFNESVNAVATGKQPGILIEPLVDVQRFGFERIPPTKFVENYDDTLLRTLHATEIKFFNPNKT